MGYGELPFPEGPISCPLRPGLQLKQPRTSAHFTGRLLPHWTPALCMIERGPSPNYHLESQNQHSGPKKQWQLGIHVSKGTCDEDFTELYVDLLGVLKYPLNWCLNGLHHLNMVGTLEREKQGGKGGRERERERMNKWMNEWMNERMNEWSE